MRGSYGVLAALFFSSLAACGGEAPVRPEPGLPTTPNAGTAPAYKIDVAHSSLSVKVARSGMLSVHDHLFVPTTWSGKVTFDPSSLDGASPRVGVDLLVDTASLHDHNDELSQSARDEVDDDMRGPDILDVKRFPQVQLVGGHFEHLVHPADARDPNTLQGELVATLSLHGHTGEVRAPMSVRWGGRWLHAKGATSFLQSEYGIEPVSKFFGALAVKDRVLVEFDVVAAQ